MKPRSLAAIAVVIVALVLVGTAGYWLGTRRAAPPNSPAASGSVTGAQAASGEAADKVDPKTGRKVL